MAEQLRLLRMELTINTHEDTDTLLIQLYEAEVALQSLRALENGPSAGVVGAFRAAAHARAEP